MRGDVNMSVQQRLMNCYKSHSLLNSYTAAQTINPIKKLNNCVVKTNGTNGKVSSSNTTKQPDDIG